MTEVVDKVEDHKNYVTICGPTLRGYFAVLVWWNPDGFWEPWQSGVGSYATAAEAVDEAKAWAEAEGIEYRMPKELQS